LIAFILYRLKSNRVVRKLRSSFMREYAPLEHGLDIYDGHYAVEFVNSRIHSSRYYTAQTILSIEQLLRIHAPRGDLGFGEHVADAERVDGALGRPERIIGAEEDLRWPRNSFDRRRVAGAAQRER
jgi:hypothetical protein